VVHRHLVLFLIVLVLLAACSSSTPQPAAPPAAPSAAPPVAPVAPSAPADTSGMATVYVYRPKAFFGMALRPTVMVDGKDLVNIGNGRVYAGHFTPGKYLIQMDDKKSGAEIDVKPGDKYFFRVEIVPGFWKGGGRMTLMDAKQGEYEITQLQPVPATEIEDKSHQ
jgi:hypothetical protein